MARTQARLLVKLWDDKDFCRLSPGAQRLYMFLLSQPNLNHAGLLALTLTRWSRSSPGVTVDSLRADLAELEDADYVVVDEDTEEVLIRTLVRNDGIWKQPKVLLAMKSDAGEIVSPKLRYRFREELLKVDLTQLPASMKDDSKALISVTLVEVIDTLPDTHPDTPGEPLPIDIPKGSGYPHTRGRAHASASTTTSTNLPQATGLAAIADTPDDPTNELLVEHVRAYAEPPPLDAQRAVKTQIMRQLALRETPERIRAGLARMREKGVAVSLLPQLIAECSPVKRTSTTDQRVRESLDVVALYEAREAT